MHTRFKYKKVKENDFGLNDEEILLLEDKELNKIVSLKKYRPYYEEEPEVNIHRVINLKKQYKDELNQKRKLLKQSLKDSLE